ncbi:hypothetical protein FRB94_010654 [Tulasnella sp. JGI-2019a]|nr:hypothetical protein FRB94_010654 [Tulasnella sp. JGI-2019a]KAG9011323.1 hypothetical protein FRB93_003125 [Tulasnella sp. JGI-2019a]KAG9037392.1 hypothetical protein FRB95_005681 [Tulasnella sp. JGI-2019a]
MSYTIKVHLNQDANPPFALKEQVSWAGAKWASGGMHEGNQSFTLTMGDNSSGGLLCHRVSDGECCFIIIGMNKGKPWCNVVPDLYTTETATSVRDTFYGKGFRNIDSVLVEEHQKTTSMGTLVAVKFFKTGGYKLGANVNLFST